MIQSKDDTAKMLPSFLAEIDTVGHYDHVAFLSAIAMEARQGWDAEERPDPKDDSAGPKDIAQNPSGQSNGE